MLSSTQIHEHRNQCASHTIYSREKTKMKKILLAILVLLLITVSACGNETKEKEAGHADDPEEQRGTIPYESEEGPIEVPADPQRVVVLSTYTGGGLKVGVNIVGADSSSIDHASCI